MVDQEDPFDGSMLLPAVEEYIILFDRFATGADMSNQIGASYPRCRAAFENAFKGTFYSLRWYNQQSQGKATADFMTQIGNMT